jgi:hypothetical protein
MARLTLWKKAGNPTPATIPPISCLTPSSIRRPISLPMSASNRQKGEPVSTMAKKRWLILPCFLLTRTFSMGNHSQPASFWNAGYGGSTGMLRYVLSTVRPNRLAVSTFRGRELAMDPQHHYLVLLTQLLLVCYRGRQLLSLLRSGLPSSHGAHCGGHRQVAYSRPSW